MNNKLKIRMVILDENNEIEEVSISIYDSTVISANLNTFNFENGVNKFIHSNKTDKFMYIPLNGQVANDNYIDYQEFGGSMPEYLKLKSDEIFTAENNFVDFVFKKIKGSGY